MLGFKLTEVRFRAQFLTHPLSERVDEFGHPRLSDKFSDGLPFHRREFMA